MYKYKFSNKLWVLQTDIIIINISLLKIINFGSNEWQLIINCKRKKLDNSIANWINLSNSNAVNYWPVRSNIMKKKENILNCIQQKAYID